MLKRFIICWSEQAMYKENSSTIPDADRATHGMLYGFTIVSPLVSRGVEDFVAEVILLLNCFS